MEFKSNVNSNDPLPLVSVIIPCYNQGHYLKECINSVRTSSLHPHIEIIVVNDGSTAIETIQIIAEYEKQENVKVIYQKNAGLSAARNTGIAASKATCFIPLDADDCLNPGFVDAALTKMNSDKTIDIVYGDCEYFGEKTGKRIANWNAFTQFYVNGLNATALIKKSVWEQCKGYDETMLNGYEDWEFWINALEHNCKFEKVETIAFRYRIKNNSMVTEAIKNHQEILNYIYQKHQDLFFKNYVQLNRQLHDVKNNRKILLHYLIRNLFGKVN